MKKIYSISEITTDIRNILEDNFPGVWLKGEVSNYKLYHASGHAYFTLKDDQAQINAVMFKGYQQPLKFTIENGMSLICHGRITVYNQRGQYQIQVDHAEPDGIGALQQAFEQLKSRLSREGLFDPSRKKPLPLLPHKIGLVTSDHGAVVHDMVTILKRRFTNINIVLYPVKVQGDGAADEIAAAITYFSKTRDCDVLIVGRGGGSLEDLWAFNEEKVARAVASCPIPVISAVGHETDFSICDFVADVRAPTPSAAAELCVPVKDDLENRIRSLRERCATSLRQTISHHRRQILLLVKAIPTPRSLLDNQRLKLGDLEDRLHQGALLVLKDLKTELTELKLRIPHPRALIENLKQTTGNLKKNLTVGFSHHLKTLNHQLSSHKLQLKLLNPHNVLKRGFVMAKTSEGTLITRRQQTKTTDKINLMFFDGAIRAEVLESEEQ